MVLRKYKGLIKNFVWNLLFLLFKSFDPNVMINIEKEKKRKIKSKINLKKGKQKKQWQTR